MIVKSAVIGVIVAAALTQAATAGSVAPKPAPAKHVPAKPAAAAKPAVAPADEYFGRMKLSILGISNTIHDTKLREGYDPVHAAANFDKLSLAEEALEDWSKKYPHDTWLPGKAYYMSHEFWAMNTADGDREAERCRSLLFTHFATSPYTTKARTEAAAALNGIGFRRTATAPVCRADRVESQPGAQTPAHRHRGPGIRRLASGLLCAEVGDHLDRIGAGGAWFETGHETVVGTNVSGGVNVFVRVMLLPTELAGGKSSFIAATPAWAVRPS